MHFSDALAPGGNAGARRLAASRAQEDRHHERHLRARASFDGPGRGHETFVALEVIGW